MSPSTQHLARALPARTFWASMLLGASMTLLSFACGEDPSRGRPPLEPPPDASPDASLPPPGVDTDGGVADAREPYDGSAASVECDAEPCVVALTAGREHYCALVAGGTVRCWGDPAMLGEKANIGVPVAVEGISAAASLHAGPDETCAVLVDGGLDCWGPRRRSIERVNEVKIAKRAVPGVDVSCAIDGDDALVCWGDSLDLGTGRRTIEIGGEKASRASVAQAAAFVVSSTGVLRSWGSDVRTLGRGTSTVDHTPDVVPGLLPVADVVASPRHVCTLGTAGDVHCWGDGVLLGTGVIRRELGPALVAFPSSAWPQQLSASSSHSCARMTNGAVYCWGGNNELGELGQTRPIGVYVPTKVDALADVVSVAVGLRSSCALTKNGAVSCWGGNQQGQLGRGSSDHDRHPKPAPVVFE